MNDIFKFIIEANDGNAFCEYVENVWEIDPALALKRFETAIKRHHYFYLKDSDRYINVNNIMSIKVEIVRKAD
ncbi:MULTISPECIES: hypothetical protein [Staphylococcus]|jgi:hypothetical protein|uniref:Uncharacterized protein n=1 Tax=Staphylococcus nepalensis TaxID=214473 RepID=A0A291JLL7_9STAP|nr:MULTISPECIES: hypothetical protein [Staphylococcus]VDG67777.1 Uncharacterised protein [Lacrimispora indolis]ATH60791.1 hypothetical protein BJD96_11015 [Staphylococcus nepalensis]ATH65821.1 hypothetical protein BJG89_11025 [Staphylococcus nepalensis]MBO1206637.1 hypothetical protein [Staphylococcus nepalensis]MBO1214202.1 hypothetical protein [Staphylococcus nepalensis]